MRSKIRNNYYAAFKYILAAALLIATFMMGRSNPALGEEMNPKFAMMRLEDIGPGGYYDSVEQLGKLRAVLDFLSEQQVPVHLAVIPRWLNTRDDGTRYEQSLDHLENPYIRAFNLVLHEAELKGASIGQHGYTHQYGNVLRSDGFQASGVGNEFDVEGAEDSRTAAFAEERIREGASILQKAGITPRFWEAPHYHTNAEQDEVFRCFYGLNYQADMSLPPAAGATYRNSRNTLSGSISLGAVYVPTPYFYIPANKDEHAILDKLGKLKNSIVSFFYHPFLEFKYLTPVIGENGSPVLRDGIPVYAYDHPDRSVLHRLVAGIKQRKYQFYSIHDYVPFTPSASYAIEANKAEEAKKPRTAGKRQSAEQTIALRPKPGDVTGDGQADLVSWDQASGEVRVIPGNYKGLRNDTQQKSQLWAKISYSKGSAYDIGDYNRDGKQDLWVARAGGKLEEYDSTGTGFVLKHTWNFPKGALEELYVLKQAGEDWAIAGQSADHSRLVGAYIHGDGVKEMKAYVFKTDNLKELTRLEAEGDIQNLLLTKTGSAGIVQFKANPAALEWETDKQQTDIPLQSGVLYPGDFDGDGKVDFLRWDSEQLTYAVFLQSDENQFRFLSVFGPWGAAGGRLRIADLDGNGKSDLALIDGQGTMMDTALSYMTKR